MERNTFRFFYPIFVVATGDESDNHHVTLIDLDHELHTGAAIPVFTELLHAERWRDWAFPNYEIVEIKSEDSFRSLLEQVKEEARYVAFDPKDKEASSCSVVSIDKAIRTMRGEAEDE